MTNEGKCDRQLGYIKFQYDSEAKWHSVCDTHGVRVQGKYGDLHGILHSTVDTLIWGDGGSGLCDGDMITHGPESCTLGLSHG